MEAELDAAAASLAVVTADGQSRLIEDSDVQKYLDLLEVEKTAQQAEGMELDGSAARTATWRQPAGQHKTGAPGKSGFRGTQAGKVKHTRRQQKPSQRHRPIGPAEPAPGAAPDSQTGRVLPTCVAAQASQFSQTIPLGFRRES